MKNMLESNFQNISKLYSTNIYKLRTKRDLVSIPTKYNFSVNPIPNSPIGIEVKNLDLKQKLDPEVISFLDTETQYFGICIFRGQGQLTATQQIQATEYFGSREIYSTHGNHPKSPHRHIFRLSNDDQVGINGPGPQWHHDGSFEEKLFTHFAMHVIKPSRNGNTYFTGMYDAYELLNQETQEYFKTLASVHSSSGVIHPLIYDHPKTNLKTMYLHLGWTAGVIQKMPDNSYRIITKEELHELMNFYHSFMEKIRYEHVYIDGDMVVADNRAVSHRGKENAYDRDIEKEGLRIVHRTTLKGDTSILPEWDLELVGGQMSKKTAQLLTNYIQNTGTEKGYLEFGPTGYTWDTNRRLSN